MASHAPMAALPSQGALESRLLDYRSFDEARQSEISFITQSCIQLRNELQTLQDDIDEERKNRREWKKRADAAEAAVQQKYVVVLVDGDGYIFRKSFFHALSNSGGSMAANELYTEIVDNLRATGHETGIGPDCDVLVNIYANKTGLSRTLAAADYLHHPAQMDQFFCSFTQSHSLFQFIDCGQGKERVDAKLRDTFKFYARNAQCQRIYLACTHDNGYIAELDKYRHDAKVMPKVMLVHAAQTPATVRAYDSLPFKSTRFDKVFESVPLEFAPKTDPPALAAAALDRLGLGPSTESTSAEMTPTASRSSNSSISAPAPNPTTGPPASTPPSDLAKHLPTTTATFPSAEGRGEAKPCIPINRQGQRVDRRLRQPTAREFEQFETRIARQKLCNEHHLRDNCESYNCKFDHNPIDDSMRNTLRHKARSIPCALGPSCRRQDCFYGHQCPWGNQTCNNMKCSFVRSGMHDIKDLEVAKLVPAQPAY